MTNFILILILLGGIAFLFAAGSLVGHISKLDSKYEEMMDKGSDISVDPGKLSNHVSRGERHQK